MAIMNLASSDCDPKNICVLAVVVAELELGNIERHVFAASYRRILVTEGIRRQRFELAI
jgi:hypothetical protein